MLDPPRIDLFNCKKNRLISISLHQADSCHFSLPSSIRTSVRGLASVVRDIEMFPHEALLCGGSCHNHDLVTRQLRNFNLSMNQKRGHRH